MNTLLTCVTKRGARDQIFLCRHKGGYDGTCAAVTALAKCCAARKPGDLLGGAVLALLPQHVARARVAIECPREDEQEIGQPVEVVQQV
jgi:hypothetical protein